MRQVFLCLYILFLVNPSGRADGRCPWVGLSASRRARAGRCAWAALRRYYSHGRRPPERPRVSHAAENVRVGNHPHTAASPTRHRRRARRSDPAPVHFTQVTAPRLAARLGTSGPPGRWLASRELRPLGRPPRPALGPPAELLGDAPGPLSGARYGLPARGSARPCPASLSLSHATV